MIKDTALILASGVGAASSLAALVKASYEVTDIKAGMQAEEDQEAEE